MQRLQEGQGNADNPNKNKSMVEDPYLKEEVHQLKLELKDVNSEKSDMRKQLQDLKVDL